MAYAVVGELRTINIFADMGVSIITRRIDRISILGMENTRPLTSLKRCPVCLIYVGNWNLQDHLANAACKAIAAANPFAQRVAADFLASACDLEAAARARAAAFVLSPVLGRRQASVLPTVEEGQSYDPSSCDASSTRQWYIDAEIDNIDRRIKSIMTDMRSLMTFLEPFHAATVGTGNGFDIPKVLKLGCITSTILAFGSCANIDTEGGERNMKFFKKTDAHVRNGFDVGDVALHLRSSSHQEDRTLRGGASGSSASSTTAADGEFLLNDLGEPFRSGPPDRRVYMKCHKETCTGKLPMPELPGTVVACSLCGFERPWF